MSAMACSEARQCRCCMPNTEAAIMERKKSLMLRSWIAAGLFFMALPGTLLGFANLLAISSRRGAAALPAAWMQGHGHAQIYGWIGCFVLGIGFYSQPSRRRSVLRIPLTTFVLWVSGVALRWATSVYGFEWRLFLPLSATMELIAMLLFTAAASHHKRSTPADSDAGPAPELWMLSVLLSTFGLLAGVIFNLVESCRVALTASSPAFPHDTDQRYLVLLGWGFLAPVVYGFSARWLPVFLGLKPLRQRLFAVALLLDCMGVIDGECGWFRTATVLLLLSAGLCVLALRIFEVSQAAPKSKGVHSSFPVFARVPYLWLLVAAAVGVWASVRDIHGGIWGASRHALTVGFVATMVFTIGPRILPHFAGIQRLFSTRLMFATLLVLQAGCILRVSAEPLAYEGFSQLAWSLLPVSGGLELTAVLLFASNLALTFLAGNSAFAKPSIVAQTV